MEQLNGFELAGRAMKVGNVTEHNPESSGGSYYDVDDMDRAGFGLGATGRIQLMAKLAEGKVCLKNTWQINTPVYNCTPDLEWLPVEFSIS